MIGRVAFIGLGVMGRPMAGHLVDAGYSVVTARRGGRPDPEFEARGGFVASSFAEAARDADIVITVLPDTPDVRQVMAGEGGVFESAPRGALVIDMSTIRPDVSVELAALGRERSLEVLDAPVSGGEAGAIAGNLSIMVGGDKTAFARALPVLEIMGGSVRRMGAAGAGQMVKAANQLIVAGNLQVLAEAIVFLEAAGIDAGAALDAIGGGLAGSTVLARRGASMVGREYTPGFRVDLHHKDLGILSSAARELGVPLPIGSAVTELMAAVRAGGGGGLDHTALLSLMEVLAGQRVPTGSLGSAGSEL